MNVSAKNNVVAIVRRGEVQTLLDIAAGSEAAEGIRQGLEDLANRRGILARKVFDELRAEFGISR